MRTPRPILPLALVLAGLGLPPAPAAAADASGPKLEYETFTLGNGMEIYVLPDRSLPQVQMITWYDVGSAHEKKGRTGFAHLFEHLMFKGSAHIPDGLLDVLLEGAGGYSNAFTSSDMTVYYNTAASNFLETMFWIEADRLAGLTEKIDQAKLDNQREVVLNERRQSYENRPYGMSHILLREALWPDGHPYHWPVIGYQEDLNAASLEDVIGFFDRHYIPAGAVMVVAGDVQAEEVKALAKKYLEWIPGGTVPAPLYVPTPEPLKGSAALSATDDVQVPRLYLAYRGPAVFSREEPHIDLAARILGGGKSSRLHERLVYQEKIAQDVSASFEGEVLGGTFEIVVTARPGVDPAELEQKVLQEIEALGQTPASLKEMEQARNVRESEFLQQLESSLWRGIQLAWYRVQARNADYLARDLERYREVDAGEVSEAVKKWLPKSARVTLVIGPKKEAE
ncbi:MAG: pitrilysin family protein [Deltaproteobacteria bacterium]|nr:pitrilysin family protein [Deltaproteobacteria bacterium]